MDIVYYVAASVDGYIATPERGLSGWREVFMSYGLAFLSTIVFIRRCDIR